MPQVNLSNSDFVVMGIYLLVIIGWGLKHARRQSAEAYFLGGRGMTWPVIGMSMMAMCVSSSSLVGWAGDAYSTGIAVFNYGIAGAIVPIVFFLVFFLPFYLRNRIYTLPEFLEGRYDARSRYYLSAVSVLGYTFLDAAVTLYAGALMVRMIFPDLSIEAVIWGIALLAASYTLIGGLSSVMWVDLVQTAVLIAGSAVLTWLAFSKAGGWDAVMSAAPPGHLHLWRPADDPSVPWPALFISVPLLGFYFWGLSQAMVQRTLSARDIDHGRFGNLFAGVLHFLVFFVMVLPGLAGRAIYPDLEQSSEIYPKMVFGLLPPGVLGLVVIGFLAAMVSTLSSILNSTQTLVTMDMIARVRPDWQGRKLVVAGNIAGLIIISVAAAWAPQIQQYDSVIKYFQKLLSYMAPPVVAVFLAGLFWKRASPGGSFAALLSGFTVALAALFLIPHSGMKDWHFLYVAPLLFVFSLAVLVTTSLFTTPASPAAVERYVWRPSFFREESLELVSRPWYANYRILSIALLLVTLVFFIVWK